MLDQHAEEQVTRHAVTASKATNRRVRHGETLETLEVLLGHNEPVSLPVVQVLPKELCQGKQEGLLDMNGRLLVGDHADPPADIEHIEEGPDVVLEDVSPSVLEDLLQTRREIEGTVAEPGTDVSVETTNDLVERDRTHQLANTGTLGPGDLLPHDELPIGRCQRVQDVRDLQLVTEVAKRDVRAELRLTDVESIEPVAFPVFGRAEVDGGADTRLSGTITFHQLSRSGDALETVDDVHGIDQVERVTTFLKVLTTHAELDVRNALALESTDQVVDLLLRDDLTLIFVNAKPPQTVRVDDTPENNVPVEFIESGLDYLDAIPHWDHVLSVSRAPMMGWHSFGWLTYTTKTRVCPQMGAYSSMSRNIILYLCIVVNDT